MDGFGTFDSCSGHFLKVQFSVSLDPEIYLIEFEINELSSGEVFSNYLVYQNRTEQIV